jgi:hypothetical protein
MLRFVPTLVAMLLVASCVAADSSMQTVDGRALQVALVEGYFWPDSVADTLPDGTKQEIEVFPRVDALVVSDPRGPLSTADAEAARAAVAAHCRAKGVEGYAPDSRFADGAWAFSPCG